eukprot:TRINITY_DN69852_c0_g1_i1.p1 TRINITY_DN69852_c0_g1~~TRINITY_DN69852_c0_g1_i1.p1  ORF type:complete len:342 (+),score=71.10 TRINITY_DN69852_c0_g1_i1:63-1088(+)
MREDCWGRRQSAPLLAGIAGALAAATSARSWVSLGGSRPARGELFRDRVPVRQWRPRGASQGRLCGTTCARAQLLGICGASIGVACSVIARAAQQGKRRRRRKAPLATIPKPQPEDRTPEEEARSKGVLARDLAIALRVTEEEVRQRREERRKKKQKERLDFEEDPIQNLVDGEDPNIFGAPYIWVQAAHATLGATTFFACVLPAISNGSIEFALFNFEGKMLETLRTLAQVCFGINFLNALVIFKEEFDLSSDLVAAGNWAFKGLVFGGVASWQRLGRLQFAKKQVRDKDIDKVIDAIASQPDGTPTEQLIDDQGKRLLGTTPAEKEKLLKDSRRKMLKR